jgi:hypothetical protein
MKATFSHVLLILQRWMYLLLLENHVLFHSWHVNLLSSQNQIGAFLKLTMFYMH